MAEVSMRDAAFTGFRVVREHPRALAVWALYALVLSLVFGGILIGLMGRDLTTLLRLSAQPATDPNSLMPIVGRIAPSYFLFVMVALGFNSVLAAAMIRAVLRPSESRLGFLRFGADELRQLGLAILTFLLFLAANFGLFGVIFGSASSPAGGFVLVVGVLGGFAALIYVAVRLSLAPALTFESRRINLLGSWALTRGRFWPLLGAYVLTVALVAMVWILSQLVVLALGVVLSGGDMQAATLQPDMSSLRAYFTPYRMIQTVLSAGVSALVWPVLFTPPVAIYRSLAPAGLTAADAFS
jgi:hypothetical protein